MLCHNGQLNEKRAPPSSLVSQLTVPPIASAIEWTMASPSPQPPFLAIPAGIEANKRFKDLFAVFWGNPWAIILNN